MSHVYVWWLATLQAEEKESITADPQQGGRDLSLTRSSLHRCLMANRANRLSFRFIAHRREPSSPLASVRVWLVEAGDAAQSRPRFKRRPASFASLQLGVGVRRVARLAFGVSMGHQ